MLAAALFCMLLAFGTWGWQAASWLRDGIWEPLRVADLLGDDLHRIMVGTGLGHWLVGMNPGVAIGAVGVALLLLRRRAIHI